LTRTYLPVGQKIAGLQTGRSKDCVPFFGDDDVEP
jgi:hypothetical protein